MGSSDSNIAISGCLDCGHRWAVHNFSGCNQVMVQHTVDVAAKSATLNYTICPCEEAVYDIERVSEEVATVAALDNGAEEAG